MEKTKNTISFMKYLLTCFLKWSVEKFTWPYQALYSKLKYNEIIEEYYPRLSEFYDYLFGINLPPPKIIWGKDPSYNPKKDFISLRYEQEEFKVLNNAPPIPPFIYNLMVFCEEEAHRYHHHANESISRFDSHRRRFEMPSDRELSEGIVKSVYSESVAKAAKIKALEILGFTEVSKQYRERARDFGRPPSAPSDLSVAFITHKLLELSDTDFQMVSKDNYFDAMAKLSPIWKDLERNLEKIVGYVRGGAVFE